jgi:hypothetical protein
VKAINNGIQWIAVMMANKNKRGLLPTETEVNVVLQNEGG